MGPFYLVHRGECRAGVRGARSRQIALTHRQIDGRSTESAARRNIEAGVLIKGGDAPQRTAEHMVALQRRGVLRPLT
jgi:hypothetical protein